MDVVVVLLLYCLYGMDVYMDELYLFISENF